MFMISTVVGHLLFASFFAVSVLSETMAGFDQTPEEVAKDHDFVRCTSKGDCGLVDKCSFKLNYGGSDDDDDDDGDSPFPEEGGEGTLSGYTVKGHVMAIKNAMDYSITFYWDILSSSEEEEEGDDDGDFSSSKHRGFVLSKPKSMVYFDTGVYGPHTVRLYVPLLSATNGSDVWAGSKEDPFSSHAESVQTLVADDDRCSRVQACKLLLNVCFNNKDSEGSQDECEVYSDACDDFSDEDELAKSSCIPECIYEYYPKEIGEYVDIDSDQVVEWIRRGGGVVGSKVDGLCNTSTVVALAVVLFFSVLLNVAAIYVACAFRSAIKAKGVASSVMANNKESSVQLSSSSSAGGW